MIIYKTTNMVNNKIYIGFDSKNKDSYLGSGLLLKRSIKKHGAHNFSKEILEYVTISIWKEREIFWIDFYNSTNFDIGYNIMKGGDGGDNLTNHPDKELIIKKRIKSNTGKRRSKEICENFSKIKKEHYALNGHHYTGIKRPKEVGEKISKSRTGMKFTEEHCKNMGDSRRGVKLKFSDEMKIKVREYRKQLVWMCNDDKRIRVLPIDINKYLELGYILGKTMPKHKIK